MLVRIVHPTRGVEKIFVVDGGTIVHEIIKANVTLWISSLGLRDWLQQFLLKADMGAKMSSTRLQGNIPVSGTPATYAPFRGFKYKDQAFHMARFGCNITLVPEGHIEVKYETAQPPSRSVIINLHIRPDKRTDRTLIDYNAIILKLFNDCFDLPRKNVKLLMQLGPRGYSAFGFQVATRSSEYYLNMMLHNSWLRRCAITAEVAAKKPVFEGFVTRASWVDNGWDDYIASPSEAQLGLSLYHFPNCSYMDLRPYAAMFSPEQLTDSVEDYGGVSSWGDADFARGYAVGYMDYEEPCDVHGVVFAHADMRGLSLFSARFQRCDFTEADLRGATINLDNMDAITLLTIARAKLDADVATELDKRLLLIHATHPRMALSSHKALLGLK